MKALFSIFLVGVLGTTVMFPLFTLTTSFYDPITHFTVDYVLLVLLASVLGLVFHAWRLFCKKMSSLLPKDWPLQKWFESTWQSLEKMQ